MFNFGGPRPRIAGLPMSGVLVLPAGVPSCSLGGCGRAVSGPGVPSDNFGGCGRVVSGPGSERLLVGGPEGEGGIARPKRIGPREPLALLLPGTGGRRRGAGEDSLRESDPDMVCRM